MMKVIMIIMKVIIITFTVTTASNEIAVVKMLRDL